MKERLFKELKERENIEAKAINTEEQALDKKNDFNGNIEYLKQGKLNNEQPENNIESDKPQKNEINDGGEKICKFF